MAAILPRPQWVNENVWITIKISLKFVAKGSINNILALVQIMAWHRSGDKPLSEPMMVYWRIYASLGLNEFNQEHFLELKVNHIWNSRAFNIWGTTQYIDCFFFFKDFLLWSEWYRILFPGNGQIDIKWLTHHSSAAYIRRWTGSALV